MSQDRMPGNGPGPECVSFHGETLRLPVYLDHQASTPLDPGVRAAMVPYLDALHGNPHSRTHRRGLELHRAIEDARGEISDLIGAAPHEILFTSGATEANNLALLGFLRARRGARHVISVVTEHEAVLQPLKAAEAEGVEVTLLPVDREGRFDVADLKAAIRPETVLVSVMAANNETGICHDLAEIGNACADHRIAFHSDAAQALSTQELDVRELGLTLLSLSGHKIYGPMGIGALYVKEGTSLAPLTFGGSQEGGRRAGTLPTVLCVGLGAACRLVRKQRATDRALLLSLRQRLKERMAAALPSHIRFLSDDAPHLPGCLSVSFEDLDAEELLFELPDLALSTGSACTSMTRTPSHVLSAMGLTAAAAAGTVRIGFGRQTKPAEIDYAAARLVDVYQRLTG